MARAFLLSIFMFICLTVASPARADIETISATIKGVVTKVQNDIKAVQDLASAVKELKQSVVQGFEGIVANIEAIVDVATNPTALAGFATGAVMQGLQGSSDGSAVADQSIEDVKTTYNRASGPNDITRARKLAVEINTMMSDSAARLYARALILRQELLEEENPDDKLDTVQDALKASQSMLIQSSKRWNKILEMQAYINEYKNSTAIQNFNLNEEETANE